MRVLRVFLGGTCNGSTWRDILIPMLDKIGIEYFNPVVDDWTPECQDEELRQRKECDFCLYVITPRLKGVYSIAEVVDDSNKRPDKTIFCVLETDSINSKNSNNKNSQDNKKFTKTQLKSLNAVGEMVYNNGGKWFKSLEEVAKFLNIINMIVSSDFDVTR